tara:strand:+ start:31 stop:570 length:540 start_codon:yes stop_codon:yes gene_type:complete
MSLIDYFLDWNRYNAKTNIGVIGIHNGLFQCSPTIKASNSIGNIGTQGIRHTTITFCMLFNSINRLCRFFGELYSNIFLKSIVTPLVVNIYFFWGKHSDDRGQDSIPPIPLMGHHYESEIFLMQGKTGLHKLLQLHFLLALFPTLLVQQLQIQIMSLFDVSCISNTIRTIGINHLGDNE